MVAGAREGAAQESADGLLQVRIDVNCSLPERGLLSTRFRTRTCCKRCKAVTLRQWSVMLPAVRPCGPPLWCA